MGPANGFVPVVEAALVLLTAPALISSHTSPRTLACGSWMTETPISRRTRTRRPRSPILRSCSRQGVQPCSALGASMCPISFRFGTQCRRREKYVYNLVYRFNSSLQTIHRDNYPNSTTGYVSTPNTIKFPTSLLCNNSFTHLNLKYSSTQQARTERRPLPTAIAHRGPLKCVSTALPIIFSGTRR